MGRDSALYEIAQWYPRMVVYDDVRGWNTDPYLGQGEFYLEYGDIDYSVTVPAGYVVAGSGVLQNRGEVLSPAQIDRLDRAARSPIGRADHHRGRSGGGKRRQPCPAPRRGASAPSTCATSRGRRRRTSAGTPPAGTASSRRRIISFRKPAAPGSRPPSRRSGPFARTPSCGCAIRIRRRRRVAGPVGGMEYPMFVMVGIRHRRIPRRSSARSITSRATSGSR